MFNEADSPESARTLEQTIECRSIQPEYTLQPAISKFQEKYYSLEPDMANGWRPNRKLFKQFPLRFSYQPADLLVSQYTKFGEEREYRVLYLGPRYSSNLKAMKSYCWKEYEPFVKECFLYDATKLNRFEFSYGKEKEKAFIGRAAEHRIFTGMNPTVDSDELLFDSDFECGNLDVVMKIAANEYDLFMRVDSNTRGHNSWFFFKVRNTKAGESITFNICNFHKTNSLYTNGLRPFFFSRLTSKEWKQLSNPVEYARKNLRYEGFEELRRNLICLSFQYKFDAAHDEVYFAYSIPYSYSYLLWTVNGLIDKCATKGILNVSYNYESSGGLAIPLLTLTNPDSNNNKSVVLITARQHPGETQGSWMMHGLLKYLCSDEAADLRSRVVFKIMPMVNVDGVVLGNFRTGALGLDLNRLFREQQSEDFYEVEYVKELASVKSNIMYMDFHGHSTRKSVFIYGPDYKLSDSEYIASRLLPKQISRLTEMFRYYSCSFKISKGKERTARASLLRDFRIPYCYTVEASTHSYTCQEGQFLFSSALYASVGERIGESLQLVVPILVGVERRKLMIKQQLAKVKEKKIERGEAISLPRMNKQGRSLSNKKTSYIDTTLDTNKAADEGKAMADQYDLFDEIRQEEKSMFESYLEGDSDCEDVQEDYTKEEREVYFASSEPLKPKKPKPSSKSPFVKPRFKKSELGETVIRRKLNDTLESHPLAPIQRKDQTMPLDKSKMIPKNQTSKKLESSIQGLVETRSRPSYEVVPPDALFIAKQEAKDSRRNQQLERVYFQSQKIMDNQQQLTKINNIILQPGMPGDAMLETVSPGKRKMSTIESRRSEADGIDQYNSRSKVLQKRCSVNRPLELGDDLVDIATRKQNNSLCYTRLPDISRKDLLLKKRKVEVVSCQSQIPEVINDILRKHMRMMGQSIQERHLNRSIQIIKL